MLIPSIQKLVEMIHLKGIKYVVISPGSRSAPLTLAVARHAKLSSFVIPDERSACFIALGIAQSTKNTVCIITTSGTASINLFPGISEAFFQKVPLLIITADRPVEWIDQLDGQTIFQENLYGQHVKKSYQFPTHENHANSNWYTQRLVNEAINLTCEYPKGPVHLNVPVREPFYPTENEKEEQIGQIKLISKKETDSKITDSQWLILQSEWSKYNKVLIVGGQYNKDHSHLVALERFSQLNKIPIVGDIISNLHSIIDLKISFHDLFLKKYLDRNKNELQPEILITYGRSILSKNLKQYLRLFKPKIHWHIQTSGHTADTFQSLSRILETDPESFFATAIERFDHTFINENYAKLWLEEDARITEKSQSYFGNREFSELEATKIIFENLPDNINLHLANSMPVRLANILCGLKNDVEIFANRGTSGIDGCTSTAVGIALVSKKLNILISGDIAFFYDRNGLWHNNLPGNIRIIVLNNHGGGIFRIIDGPSKLPELEDYFETHQKLGVRHTAMDFNMDYFHCKDAIQLGNHLSQFLADDGKSKILEIETKSKVNKVIFDQYISQFF